MRKYRRKVIVLLTFIISIMLCTVCSHAATTTEPGRTYSDTLSVPTSLTFINTRNVSVPTNASYPIYVFIAIAVLAAVILFITIKQRRAAND
jgi:subtilase family serine protease